jgi:hypothetical protein
MTVRVFIVIALLLVLGCSESGDFSQFIVQEVKAHGGRVQPGSTIPRLDATWRIKRDENGFELVARGVSFAEVDGVLRQAFGTPMPSGISSGNEKGLPYSNWAAMDAGADFMVIGYLDRIEVNCVKGQPLEEVLKRIPAALDESN